MEYNYLNNQNIFTINFNLKNKLGGIHISQKYNLSLLKSNFKNLAKK